MERKNTPAINWINRKKLELAAALVLVPAAVACGGEKGDTQTFKPTPIGPDVPPVTFITQIPTEVPPTPTPEAKKFAFGHYDVYSGDIEGGGKIVITGLVNPSNGIKYCVIVSKDQPRATNGSYAANFSAASEVSQDKTGFSFFGGFKRKVEAKLEGQTVVGTINQEAYETTAAGAKVTFPAFSLKFTAEKTGTGKIALLQAYEKGVAAGLGVAQPTDADAALQIQRGCGITPPEN